MVYNTFVKCEVCNSITRIRLQVGWLEQHPIVVSCGKCGISLAGKVHINQNNPGLSFVFDNAKSLDFEGVPDYAVECSGEFPTRKLCDNQTLENLYITPFLRFQQRTKSDDDYQKFTKSVHVFKQTIKNWHSYKRILELEHIGNKEYIVQEVKKIFPEKMVSCRNELEIMRAVRMIEIHGFSFPLRPEIIEMPEVGSNIFKLNYEKIKELICYLNNHDGFSLKALQAQIYKIYDGFITVFPYLIPAFSMQFIDSSQIDMEIEGTTTSSYSDVKQFYLDVYETLGNLLIIPVALDNINYRNNINAFKENNFKVASLDDFINLTKAKRFHFYNNSEIYVRTLDAKYNQKLRNAIGHNDVEYDAVSQKITYIPDSKNRTKKLTEYLLEFEFEAIKMFQAVLIVSEYLYRLREMELIDQGVIPLKMDRLPIRNRKIGRNEKCPCGSGLKYKNCHGKYS